MNKRQMGFLAFLICFMVNSAWAQTQGISFQAVIKDPTGNAPNATGIPAKLLVLAPTSGGNNCVLRSELHTGVNITDGYMNLTLGGVSGGANPGDGFNPATTLELAEALDNTVTRNGLNCVDGNNTVVSTNQSYIPLAGHSRILRLAVNIGGDTIIADFNLRASPYAINSQTLNGKEASAFIQSKTATRVTQANLDNFFTAMTSTSGHSVRWNGSSFASYDPSSGANLTAGSIPSTALASVAWAKLTGVPAGVTELAGLSCATGKILKRGATAWTCADETVPTESDPTVRTYAKNAPGAGLTVNSNVLQLDFATTATAGKAVQANDPRLSDARSPLAHNHSYANLVNTTGSYLTYIPGGGTACTPGQTLKWDGSRWVCGNDNAGTGGPGGVFTEEDPTVVAFAKVNPGLGLTTDVTNALMLDFATTPTAGKAVQANDPRLSDARAPTAHSHPVSQITSIAGAYFTYQPNNAPCSEGNVLKWSTADGGRWECGTDLEGDGTSGGSPVLAWPAGTSGQFMKYSGGGWGGFSLAESDIPGLPTKLSGFTTDISALQTSVSGFATQISDRVSYSQLPSVPCATHQTLSFSSPSHTWVCADIDYSASRLPAATNSAAGIVTTTAQNFAGVKTFDANALFKANIEVDGTATVAGNINALGASFSGAINVAALKMSGANAPCNSTTKGLLKLTAAEDGIEFCDGSNWLALGGDGGGGGNNPGGGTGGGDLPDACMLYPPEGMPCADGTFYSGVFNYDFRDRKRTTVAPPGCYLSEAEEGELPEPLCPDDETEDTMEVPWVLGDVPTSLCGAGDQRNGMENRNDLSSSACFDELAAPKLCGALDIGGDDTFYLPSIQELKHLFDNRAKIGGFKPGIYWSSTESAPGQALAIDFSGTTGSPVPRSMGQLGFVRCMRHF